MSKRRGVMKSFYCEKYNAICMSEKCSEGIEVEPIFSRPQYLYWECNDGTHGQIEGFNKPGMRNVVTGESIYLNEPPKIGYICDEEINRILTLESWQGTTHVKKCCNQVYKHIKSCDKGIMIEGGRFWIIVTEPDYFHFDAILLDICDYCGANIVVYELVKNE
jgi:hypothetical protein